MIINNVLTTDLSGAALDMAWSPNSSWIPYYGGYTIIHDGGGNYGVALCSHEDVFDPSVGSKIARDRFEHAKKSSASRHVCGVVCVPSSVDVKAKAGAPGTPQYTWSMVAELIHELETARLDVPDVRDNAPRALITHPVINPGNNQATKNAKAIVQDTMTSIEKCGLIVPWAARTLGNAMDSMSDPLNKDRCATCGLNLDRAFLKLQECLLHFADAQREFRS